MVRRVRFIDRKSKVFGADVGFECSAGSLGYTRESELAFLCLEEGGWLCFDFVVERQRRKRRPVRKGEIDHCLKSGSIPIK